MTEHAHEIPVDAIHDNPIQPRFEMSREVIAGARAAIEDAGCFPISMALTVRPRAPGGWEIIAGHHRVLAARDAGLLFVWAYVQELNDKATAIALATTNNQASMTPLEHARHALHLEAAHEVTTAEYARLIGKTPASMRTAMRAYQVLEPFGGPTGIYASVSVAALAALDDIEDVSKRGALLLQFQRRRTSAAQADAIIGLMKGGSKMREAFDAAEGKINGEPHRDRKDTTTSAAQRNEVAIARQNAEIITAYEWTLALYQARSEEFEARFGKQVDAVKDGFNDAVGRRQRRILDALQQSPGSVLVTPKPAQVACASCAHGKVNRLSDIGYECRAGRAAGCLPLSLKKYWVERDDQGATA